MMKHSDEEIFSHQQHHLIPLAGNMFLSACRVLWLLRALPNYGRGVLTIILSFFGGRTKEIICTCFFYYWSFW